MSRRLASRVGGSKKGLGLGAFLGLGHGFRASGLGLTLSPIIGNPTNTAKPTFC